MQLIVSLALVGVGVLLYLVHHRGSASVPAFVTEAVAGKPLTIAAF